MSSYDWSIKVTLLRIRIPTPILLLFVIDLALGLAYLADGLAGHPYPRLTRFIDLNREGNLPAWYASIQWFGVACLWGVFAQHSVRRASPRSWSLVAITLVFVTLSLDEIAQLHEWLGRLTDRWLPGGSRANTPFGETGIWMVVI